MDKFKVIKELGLKSNEYCVVGGAVEVLGIRMSNDVDLLVSKAAFNRIASKFNLPVTTSFLGSKRMEYGIVEIFSDDGFGRTASDWISNSQMVHGIRIGSLGDLIDWKVKLKGKPGRNPEKLGQDQADIDALCRMLDEKYYEEQYRINEDNIWY